MMAVDMRLSPLVRDAMVSTFTSMLPGGEAWLAWVFSTAAPEPLPTLSEREVKRLFARHRAGKATRRDQRYLAGFLGTPEGTLPTREVESVRHRATYRIIDRKLVFDIPSALSAYTCDVSGTIVGLNIYQFANGGEPLAMAPWTGPIRTVTPGSVLSLPSAELELA